MSTTATEFRSRHRWSVADYYKMVEAGLLNEDSTVELIDGEVIEMAPIGSGHASAVMRLNQLLGSRVLGRAIVSPQNPVRLDDHSEPQPDIAVLRWRDDFYRDAHPTPADVLLLIEVADSSTGYDSQVKVPLYARHGIPEVWLIDVNRHRLTTYRHRQGKAYEEVTEHSSGRVSLEELPDVAIALEELFPGK